MADPRRPRASIWPSISARTPRGLGILPVDSKCMIGCVTPERNDLPFEKYLAYAPGRTVVSYR